MVNEKLYIGSAVDIAARWGRHRFDLRHNRHHNAKLQNAWNKYGEGTFEFEVIHVCDKPYLFFFEQIMMDGYDVCVHGYNIQPKARSSLGRKQTEETKKKLSEHFKGKKRNLSSETRDSMAEKVRASKLGKKRNITPEWRAKINAAKLGVKMPIGFGDKVRQRMLGYKHTPEAIAKMSESHKGYKPSAEQIKKSADSRRGVKRGKYKTTGKYNRKQAIL